MAEATRLTFRDLDLMIREDAYGDCWVEAVGAPGARSEPVRLTLDDPQIITWVRRFRNGEADAETAKALGRALWTAVFSDQIAMLWDRMRGTLGRQTALRVRLDIRKAFLANLPWELMRPDAAVEDEIALAFSPRRLITRCAYDLGPRSGFGAPDQLRILVAVATPDDQERFDWEAVVHAVERSLAREVSAGRAVVDVVSRTTKGALDDALLEGCDVLHFVGHGRFAHEESCLLLETREHGSRPLDARELGRMLAGTGVRLFVATACNLAAASLLDPRLGIADAALHADVPAVVAMQGYFSDRESAAFSQGFYTALINGEPLETCVTEGRARIFSDVNGWRSNWAAPVLYTNVQDGLLFDHFATPDGRGDAPAQPRRTLVESLPTPWYEVLWHRDDELRRIIDAITAERPQRVVVIEGEPGTGSSSLALEAARRCLDASRNRPPSRQTFAGAIWVSGRRPPLQAPPPVRRTMGWSIEDLYRRLDEALPTPGLAEAGPDERWDLLRAALRQERYLIVIDDFDELRGLNLEQLVDRVPEPTVLLVTTHEPLVTTHELQAAGGLRISAGHFAAGDAADLFRRMARSLDVAGNLGALSERIGRASGNTLVLRLLAGRLTAGLGVRLPAPPEHPSAAPDTELLRRLISDCLDGCSEGERSLLETIAIFPEPIGLTDLAELTRRPAPELVTMLGRLGRLGLAQFDDGATVQMARRIRLEVLRDLTDEGAEARITEAVEDMLEILDGASAKPGGVQPRRTRAQVGNALWAASQAHALHDWKGVLSYRDRLHESLFRQGMWRAGVRLGKWAYDAADRIDDDESQAWCALYPLARHCFYRKDYDQARLWSERALDKFTRLGQGHGIACAKRYLGRVMAVTGRPTDALRLYREGLGEQDVHADMRGHLITAIAEHDQRRGELEAARDGYEKARAIYSALQDDIGMGTAEHHLGEIALAFDQFEEAREHMNRALRLFERNDWLERCGQALKSLAELEQRAGDEDRARGYLRHAEHALKQHGAWAELAGVGARLAGLGFHDPAQGVPLGALGAADLARLVGDTDWMRCLWRNPVGAFALQCPVAGCPERRIVHDRWEENWPHCLHHHERLVQIVADGAVG
ncbi:CHAT domain-containing protein [Actinomadura gamaensis]|uniref:CHAT domain-containing protein n=1 Tax=Actinomadura gamaensis TaxID=1763541 RepID=A0ABV9TV36_9ACTN